LKFYIIVKLAVDSEYYYYIKGKAHGSELY